MEISSIAVEPLWQAAFGDADRPKLYKSNSAGEDGFMPLSDPQDFIKDLNGMSHAKLYALSANGQLAMKQAQDEYLSIDKIIKKVKGKEFLSDPQGLEDPDIFEEEKEATLYGYKYRRDKPALLNATQYNREKELGPIPSQQRRDVRLPQDPFAQGGFYPKWTESQFQKVKAAAKDPNNIDGWEPLIKDGKRLVPRLNSRKTEREEELGRRERSRYQREGDEGQRPDTSASLDSPYTPSKPINKPLTRFRGSKHPPTRDVSEAPSAMSTPGGRRQNTPDITSQPVTPVAYGSPGPKRRKLNPAPKATARTVEPGLFSMSRKELFDKKWEGSELVAAVTANHSWLNEDPIKAEHWKEKIIHSKFPVRTFSMFKKWAFWKDNGQAKRPRRGKGDNSGTPKPTLGESEAEQSEDPLQRDPAETAPGQGLTVGPAKRSEDVDETEEEFDAEAEEQLSEQLQSSGATSLKVDARSSPSWSSGPNTPTRRSTRTSRRASQ